jgi:hypothetical protein
MDKTKPRDREAAATDKTPSSQENSVKHIVRTGLPPGVDADDWKDPGKAGLKGPTDNRS